MYKVESLYGPITYEEIRFAMLGEAYTMSLVGEASEEATRAVNQGIDSHLEACFCPDRGDSYKQSGHRLECVVSIESLPVLLRRLFESETEEGESLASDILYSLGFDECGQYVGREALGLE